MTNLFIGRKVPSDNILPTILFKIVKRMFHFPYYSAMEKYTQKMM